MSKDSLQKANQIYEQRIKLEARLDEVNHVFAETDRPNVPEVVRKYVTSRQIKLMEEIRKLGS